MAALSAASFEGEIHAGEVLLIAFAAVLWGVASPPGVEVKCGSGVAAAAKDGAFHVECTERGLVRASVGSMRFLLVVEEGMNLRIDVQPGMATFPSDAGARNRALYPISRHIEKALNGYTAPAMEIERAARDAAAEKDVWLRQARWFLYLLLDPNPAAERKAEAMKALPPESPFWKLRKNSGQ